MLRRSRVILMLKNIEELPGLSLIVGRIVNKKGYSASILHRMGTIDQQHDKYQPRNEFKEYLSEKEAIRPRKIIPKPTTFAHLDSTEPVINTNDIKEFKAYKTCCLVSFSRNTQSLVHPVILLMETSIRNQVIERSFVCDICFTVRPNKNSLDRHKHSHELPIPCEYCGKSLKCAGRPDVRKRHLIVCKEYAYLKNAISK